MHKGGCSVVRHQRREICGSHAIVASAVAAPGWASSFPSCDFPATEPGAEHRNSFSAGELDRVLVLPGICEALFPFPAYRADLFDGILEEVNFVATVATIRRGKQVHCHIRRYDTA